MKMTLKVRDDTKVLAATSHAPEEVLVFRPEQTRTWPSELRFYDQHFLTLLFWVRVAPRTYSFLSSKMKESAKKEALGAEDSMTETLSNQEQIQYWNEHGGARWVRMQERLDAQIESLGLAAMQRAAVKPGERVLDVGCGCGQTALELAKRVGPHGSVLGVDISRPMLARARERQRERQVENLEFVWADAQTHPFEREHFDLIYSRFGVMFFDDPPAAFHNLRTALRPTGRLCFICWQALDRNEWVRVPLQAAAKHIPLPAPPAPGAPGPFSLADPDRVRGMLEASGFTEVRFDAYEADLSLGAARGVDEAVAFLCEIGPIARLVRDAEETVRTRVIQEIRTALAPYASQDGVHLHGTAWIVHARPAR